MAVEITLVVSEVSPGRFVAHVDRDLVCESRTPLLSGARVLLERGVPPETGLVMRHAESLAVAMRTTVGVAAALTVEEPPSGGGPRFACYDAFSAPGERPRTGVRAFGVESSLETPRPPVADAHEANENVRLVAD
jgi:hypothetical protein